MSGEEVPTYRNQPPPANVLQAQGVTAFLDGIQILPHIQVFFDPPSSLLKTAWGVRIVDQAGGEEFKPVLQEWRRRDQFGEGPTDLKRETRISRSVRCSRPAAAQPTCFILTTSWPGR